MFWNKLKKKQRIEKVELINFGFRVTFNNEISELKWVEIIKLIGFKIDRIAIDDICLKIETENITVYLSEEYEGWREFMNELLKHFPEVNQYWEGIIAKPAFARNETELYNKEKTSGNSGLAQLGFEAMPMLILYLQVGF